MDDFREWLSDNLRYFMLGFGILAVVLILFFGVRFISSKFENQKTTEPKQEAQQEAETPTPTQEAEETPIQQIAKVDPVKIMIIGLVAMVIMIIIVYIVIRRKSRKTEESSRKDE